MTPEKIDRVEPDLDGTGLRVGLVQARFNELHTKTLLHACVAELDRLGVASGDITCASVPGALEIPLALRAMAETGEFDALIAIGTVVRGETYHFEVVSNESARGVTEVALATGVPIANAILTVDTDEQAAARASEKGTDAARVAVEMANLMLELAPDDEGQDDD